MSGRPRPGRTPRAGLALVLLVAGACAEAARGAEPRTIRVAATGAPRSGPDTVGTLAEALALARRLRARDPAAGLAVVLDPGLHRLATALRLGKEDGGAPGAPFVVRGPPDGSARLVGSVALRPETGPIDPALLARIPEAARGAVRLYRLPAAARERSRLRESLVLGAPPAPLALEVFDGEGPMHPARWPDEGFAVASAPLGVGFALAGRAPASWRDERDLWAEGYWRWGWLFEALPVVAVTPEGGGARVSLSRIPYEGILPDARVRIVHALSELDRPGEWWRDAARGILIAWPRGGDTIEVSVLDTLVAVEGASHVRLEDLRLEAARGDLVTVTGGRDVVIARSRLARAGARGAVFSGSADSGLVECDVTQTGDGAVALDAGDRPTLTPGGLFVRDSRLTGFARLAPTQRAGIAVDGVGAVVEGNLIRDSEASAILLRGNDHRVRLNEIADVLRGATDAGAIYSGRDWTARGTVIADNFLHDVRAAEGREVKGVYLDDMASGFTVTGNLFLRVDQPVFIGGGRDNRIERNLFVASSPAVHVDSRGETWARDAIADPQSQLRAALAAMPVGSALWRVRYPALAGILSRDPGQARDNLIVGNVLLDSAPFRFVDGGRDTVQTLVGNVGPQGVRIGKAVAPDLARTSVRPDDFTALTDSSGRALPPVAQARMRRSLLAGAPFAR